MDDLQIIGAVPVQGSASPMGGQIVRLVRNQVPAQVMTQAQALQSAPAPEAGPPRASRPLGFASHTFVNGAATVATLTGRPSGGSSNFRYTRLSTVRSDVGAAAPGLSVDITDIRVGSDSILAGAGAVPVESFQGDASLKSNIDTGFVAPNTDITIGLSISAAPAVGESVRIGAVMFPV